MSKDILSLISSKMNTFSKGQKLIANYILSSYDKAAFMTPASWARPFTSVNPPWCALPWS